MEGCQAQLDLRNKVGEGCVVVFDGSTDFVAGSALAPRTKVSIDESFLSKDSSSLKLVVKGFHGCIDLVLEFGLELLGLDRRKIPKLSCHSL